MLSLIITLKGLKSNLIVIKFFLTNLNYKYNKYYLSDYIFDFAMINFDPLSTAILVPRHRQLKHFGDRV